MPKITMIGAGSVVFSKALITDILSFPELGNSEIALMDIDPERLRVAEAMAHRIIQELNVGAKVSVYEDRKKALEGADYAINMIQVGGYKPATVTDFEIPKKYGLRQTIADTLGIGGIFRALRTIPVMIGMARDMEEVCPDVQFINYSNPMCMNTMAVSKATKIKTVGLCHSVHWTAWQLCQYLKIPLEEVTYQVAGINHMAFFLKFQHKGQDLYPLLRERMYHPEVVECDKVRFEMFRRLGYYVTESSEHFSEYCPHFIRRDRPDLIEKFSVPLDEYITRCINNNAWWEDHKDSWAGEEKVELSRSPEYGSTIIHSMETGKQSVIYGNVLNKNIITNLPYDCCVEVPCLVDKNGIQPTVIGNLPPQLAAICRTNVNVQELTVEAALTGKKEHIYHAAMLDPHTAAELTLDEIWSLCDDLIEAHGNMLPEYH